MENGGDFCIYLQIKNGVNVDVAVEHGTGGYELPTWTHCHCGQGQTVRDAGSQQESRSVPQL